MVLYYLGGYDIAVTARILGIRKGAVKVRLHRARRELANRLEPLSMEGISDGSQ
jgi:DNA-directed RNA polymerase specialized sigma24 family protein